MGSHFLLLSRTALLFAGGRAPWRQLWKMFLSSLTSYNCEFSLYPSINLPFSSVLLYLFSALPSSSSSFSSLLHLYIILPESQFPISLPITDSPEDLRPSPVVLPPWDTHIRASLSLTHTPTYTHTHTHTHKGAQTASYMHTQTPISLPHPFILHHHSFPRCGLSHERIPPCAPK